MKKKSLIKRVSDLYKNLGLKLMIFRIFQKMIFAYIRFLNKRRLKSITKVTKSVVKDINGSKMRLDVSMDDGLCRFLAIAGIREPHITEVMKRDLREGEIFVDIGANIGYYALLEAKMLGNNGKVYAIEPVPDTIGLLRENIALNNYSNIEIYQTAIGDRSGTASMYVGKWLNRSQIKEVGTINSDRITQEITTPLSTLDDFLEGKPYPNALRMDTEGYEYNIIKGMKRMLAKNLPLKLYIEFHFRWLGKEKSIELLRILKEADFEIGAATFETDEKCITYNRFLSGLAGYLNSMVCKIPLEGGIKISIDDIINNTVIWDNKEGAYDLCERLGALEIMFKRP